MWEFGAIQGRAAAAFAFDAVANGAVALEEALAGLRVCRRRVFCGRRLRGYGYGEQA